MTSAEPDNCDESIDWDFEEDDEMDMKEVGQREMNREECEEYYEAVSASQGFDVPYFPHIVAFGRIQPMHDVYLRGSHAKMILNFVNLAIEDYNNRSGLKYEIVEIIKANKLGVKDIFYFITFSVKPANAPTHFSITIFQAKVYHGIDPDDVQIRVCRPKPYGTNPAEGNEGGCCCSCSS